MPDHQIDIGDCSLEKLLPMVWIFGIDRYCWKILLLGFQVLVYKGGSGLVCNPGYSVQVFSSQATSAS